MGAVAVEGEKVTVEDGPFEIEGVRAVKLVAEQRGELVEVDRIFAESEDDVVGGGNTDPVANVEAG